MLGLGAIASAVYMGREWEEGEVKQLKLVSGFLAVPFCAFKMSMCIRLICS
jgi:hypothetical protein